MSDTPQPLVSLSFGGALFLLFLGLRLTDNIDWKWYWVAAPLWVPISIAVSIIVLTMLVAAIGGLFSGIAKGTKKTK